MNGPYTVITCACVRETDAAVMIEVENKGEVWVPFSQVKKIVRRGNGHDEVEMTQWIAQRKGLI
jgi:hypothetical protein